MYAEKYTGKYAARKTRRKRRNWPCALLFALNIMLLMWATFRVFSAEDAVAAEVPTEERIAHSIATFMDPILFDTEAPVISGVADIVTYAGDAVSYRSGVTVTDNVDTDVELIVDSSNVDLSTEGEYEVIYSAADSAGNSTSVTAAVTVLPKEAGYVDMETIYDAADEVLTELFWPNITLREQVGAIYSWTHENLSYGGHSDRTDWHQAAYTMLTSGRGDCFGYFAVTKLFFERLGIPNIDVQKVKNYAEDSNHYWSLVSIDGGKNYYHFDATPRVGQDQDFCLVTDAILDAYSDANKGSHNRDKQLYPATPEERPWE